MSDKPPFRISPPLAALGLFVVVAIGFGIWFALQKAPLPLQISEQTTVVTTPLDERGRIDYETPLNDILGRGVTPETNAMVALTRVIGPRPEGGRGMHADWWKRLGAEEPPEDGEYLKDDTTKWFNDLLAGDYGEPGSGVPDNRKQALREEEDRLRSEPWIRSDSPHYAEWLKANDKPLSMVAEAVKRPHYFHPIIARDKEGNKQDLYNALLPYCQKMRYIASILTVRAMWHLGEGRTDLAWADVMTIHRLGGLMITNPCTLIEYLVGVAIRTIAMANMVKVVREATPDSDRLERWRKDFVDKLDGTNWETMIGVYERYMGLDSILSIMKSVEEKTKSMFEGEKEMEAIYKLRGGIDWNEVLTTFNGHFDVQTEQTVKLTKPEATYEQRQAAKAALDDLERSITAQTPNTPSQRIAHILTKLFLPAMTKVAIASLRLQQQTTFINLMFKLEADRIRKGKYPATLAEMQAPRDVFTGQPITYKKLPNGYYLHSVGQNNKDDFNEQYDEPSHGDDVVVKVIRK
jgi:hypothetical protein